MKIFRLLKLVKKENIFIPPVKRMFIRGILESAGLSISPCPSVYKVLFSVKALMGVLSQI